MKIKQARDSKTKVGGAEKKREEEQELQVEDEDIQDVFVLQILGTEERTEKRKKLSTILEVTV